jgi:arabinan endo-1,5-alpha-L-arabinosidase
MERLSTRCRIQVLLCQAMNDPRKGVRGSMLKRDQIQIRDPYVLRDDSHNCYYLYGSTDTNIWQTQATGFDAYRSADLENWEGPFPAFRPEPDFWSDRNYWAPEVHVYKGDYYMLATFKAEGVCRGTQILRSHHPLGPYLVHSDGPVTPKDWECLDGTLHVDDDGKPWMIFCHEWVQVLDGTVCAVPLSEQLDGAVGDPIVLFKATDAAWVDAVTGGTGGTGINPKTGYVTDGPFLHRCADGTLLMLWSSFKGGQYAQAIAISTSGHILGPWIQAPAPLYESDGGHGMIFTTFDSQIMLALHTPNQTPDERPIFLKLSEIGGRLVLQV